MKRAFVIMLGLTMALAGMFVVPAGKSFAATEYHYHYVTDDGISDATLLGTPSGADITIQINSQYQNGTTPVMNPTVLSAQICNRSTGNCTSVKSFNWMGAVTFTGMLGGDYDVYLYDNQASYYYAGWATYNVN